jgi:hypothetical protein
MLPQSKSLFYAITLFCLVKTLGSAEVSIRSDIISAEWTNQIVLFASKVDHLQLTSSMTTFHNMIQHFLTLQVFTTTTQADTYLYSLLT